MVYGDTLRDNEHDGILVVGSSPRIVDCLIDSNERAGIRIQTAGPESIIIENCIISDNPGNGISRSEGRVRVTWCQFSGNEPYGVLNDAGGQYVDARSNCWGHPTGPSGAGPGLGDAVSDFVLYYPWLANGVRIASSSRSDPTAMNNARKIVRDECPPFYKVVYTDEMGVWITMASDPVNGPWTDPIEVWPVDMTHHSGDPAIAIEKNDPASHGLPYSPLHLVWSEHIPDETAPGEIYYSHSEDAGLTWNEPLNLSNTPGTASDYPSIAVDGTDVVHVVWQEWAAMAPDIFYTNNSVDGWTVPVVISRSSMPDMYPAIASNYQYYYGAVVPSYPDDRVHIAWTQFGPNPAGGGTPWIAYRGFDPVFGWIPRLDSLPEDATAGMGGAFASIIAYPSLFEVGRAPAVTWHWPYHDEEPPVSPSGIYFNERTPGIWGTPRAVWEWIPDLDPSRYASLTLQAGPFSDTLWTVWEEWGSATGRSEVYSAYSTDFGQTWNFYLNLSQTYWDLSLYPNLAYQKGVTFNGLYDLCWTEIELDAPLQNASHVYYIGATALEDSIYAGVSLPVRRETSPIVATCFPNPTSSEVRFAVSVTKQTGIQVSIYDIRGRLVTCMKAYASEPGTHTLAWDCKDMDGTNVASGVYFYEVTGAGAKVTGRTVVLR